MSTEGGRKARLFGRPGPLTVPLSPFGRSGPPAGAEAPAAPIVPAVPVPAIDEAAEPTIRLPARPASAGAAPAVVDSAPAAATPAPVDPPESPAESPAASVDEMGPPADTIGAAPALSSPAEVATPAGSADDDRPTPADATAVVTAATPPDAPPSSPEAPRPPTPVLARDAAAPPGGEPTVVPHPVDGSPGPAVGAPEEAAPAALEEASSGSEAVDPEADTLRELRIGDVEDVPAAVEEPLETPRPLAPWERPVARVSRTFEPNRFSPPARRLPSGAPTPPAVTSVSPGAPPPPAVTSVSPASPDAPETWRSRGRPLRPQDGSPPRPAPSAVPRMATAPTATALPEEASATAPGKIILIGEHAVVYGHRAIAAAVDLGTTVSLYRRPGPSRVEDTPIHDPRLGTALASVIPADGVGVRIRSTLPVGCGMGSSAALAVATIRALAKLEGREATQRECVERGFEMERVFHGNPSGLDHTVSASGGVLLYRRGEAAEELKLARPLRLVIANSGNPGNTAEMVAKVRERNPVEQLMRIGALVEMVAARLARGEPIGEFIREAHRNLRLMGVSTPALDDLCRAMEAGGAAGAKLAGAGGGGIVIAVVDERTEESVRRAASGLAAGGVWTATIG